LLAKLCTSGLGEAQSVMPSDAFTRLRALGSPKPHRVSCWIRRFVSSTLPGLSSMIQVGPNLNGLIKFQSNTLARRKDEEKGRGARWRLAARHEQQLAAAHQCVRRHEASPLTKCSAKSLSFGRHLPPQPTIRLGPENRGRAGARSKAEQQVERKKLLWRRRPDSSCRCRRRRIQVAPACRASRGLAPYESPL